MDDQKTLMDRKKILSVINGLETTDLINMLAAQGVVIQQPQNGQPGGNDGLDSWNKRRIEVGPDNRPQLFNRENVLTEAAKQVKPGLMHGEELLGGGGGEHGDVLTDLAIDSDDGDC